MPPPSKNTAPAVFEARGLRKVYHTGELDVVALHGVDLVFSEGELVVLLGASGSGKSTLLNILGGLDQPTSGALRYKGWDLTDGSERTLT
ncbi:MAG: ATP-binding cassette domain-containing protein, partial [Verrucomicrobiaceae bacterium]|nr:ATP-binding cassette domain-containing protein [Verrucomicrobiaceae bacterium]